jgi:hypothetical protein
MLSGVSLSAERFFYPNPLESNGQHQRSAWFGCACCPSNVARFVPAIPGYIYAVTDEDLYVNLFISNDADILLGKRKVGITQKADFPWNGNVELFITPENSYKFNLRIRIPGWASNQALPGDLYRFTDQDNENVKISVNGKELDSLTAVNGYAVLSRKWKQGDQVMINFPMPVRKVSADERVTEDSENIAFQRGPVIYCAEWPDNNTGNVLDILIKKDASTTTEFVPSLLNGTQVIKTTGFQTKRTVEGDVEVLSEEPVTLIPYALWNNRGAGQMMVWFPTTAKTAHPLPAPTIAFRSKIRASKLTKTLSAVNDQAVPLNSNDNSVINYNWFPDTDKWEWIEYDFEKPEIISEANVYWFDDGPEGGCRIPDEWEILYLDENIWKSVGSRSGSRIAKDNWNIIKFKPVRASSLKIKVKLNKKYSAGIYEWIVK